MLLKSDRIPNEIKISEKETVKFGKEKCRIEKDRILLALNYTRESSFPISISPEIIFSDIEVGEDNTIKFKVDAKGPIGIALDIILKPLLT